MITAPVLPLHEPRTCPCGTPATWLTRRGPRCAACTHPALIRLALAVARDAERVAL